MNTPTSEQAPKEFEGRISKDRDWRQIVAWVGDLPPMPHVASRAISMVENPDTTAQELTDLLATDTALAARVLKIANSAMFSRQREITTLNQAIMVIGFKALKGIIVAATLRQITKNFGKLQKLIWENSMCTAMCATVVSKHLKKRYVEEIFLLGLLHSLGQIVLLVQSDTAKDYPQVIKLIKEKTIDYVAAESQVIGFSHSLLGALVAKKWNFSPETCQVILHYKDPVDSDKPETELEEKTAVVQLGDMISHAAGVGSPEGYPKEMEKIYEVAKYLGFNEATMQDDIAEIITETQKRFEAERHVYE